MATLVNARKVRIEWGDCDPSGIVFFPRYLAFFDESTAHLFERALGCTKFQMLKNFDFGGMPLVDVHARFIIPSKYGDDVVIESSVAEFGRSSFQVQHRLLKSDALAVEGFEKRVWVMQDPKDPSLMKSHPIPTEVKERFGLA